MPLLGADPETLRSLATRLRGASHELDDVAVSLERRVRSTGWRGVDADEFGRRWQLRDRPAMRAVADRFREAATALDRQAQEQLRASAAEGSGTGADVTAAAPAATAATADRVPSPAPLPRSEFRLTAGTDVVGGLLLGGLAHDVTVQQLSQSRSRVVVTEARSAGAAATSGASVRLGGSGAALGTSGRVHGSVGSIVRREYLVPDHDVWPTVAKVEAELGVGRVVEATRALPGLGLAAEAASVAVAVWDRVLDHLPGPDIDLRGTVDDLAVAPTPDRVEELGELTLGAGAGAALVSSTGAHAGAEVSGAVRFGTGRGGEGGDSHILELEGAVAASIGGSLLERLDLTLPGDLDRSFELRLEFLDRPVDGVDLVVTTTSTGATGLHQQTSNLSLSAASREAAGVAVASSLGDLRAGDPTAALRALADVELTAESIATVSGEMTVADHTFGGGVAAGQGVGAALSGDAGVQRWHRVR